MHALGGLAHWLRRQLPVQKAIINELISMRRGLFSSLPFAQIEKFLLSAQQRGIVIISSMGPRMQYSPLSIFLPGIPLHPPLLSITLVILNPALLLVNFK